MQRQDFEEHREFLDRVAKTLYYGEGACASPAGSPSDCLSFPLTELAAELFSDVKEGCDLDRLPLEHVSDISRAARVSTCSLVMAILYLERIKSSNPQYIDRVAPSEIFLVSLMVASKFLNDSCEDDVLNSEWATASSLSLQQVNSMEKDFLQAIDWRVSITEADFWTRLKELELAIGKRQALRRGWFSYTDLNTALHLQSIVNGQKLLAVATACLLGYATSVLTLVGLGAAVANSISSFCITEVGRENLVLLPDCQQLLDGDINNCTSNNIQSLDGLMEHLQQVMEDKELCNYLQSQDNDSRLGWKVKRQPSNTVSITHDISGKIFRLLTT